MVICLERGADLHMAQLMTLPHTVSCFSKIQIGFTFLVPAHLGSPGKRAVKRVCPSSFLSPLPIPIAKWHLRVWGSEAQPARQISFAEIDKAQNWVFGFGNPNPGLGFGIYAYFS